jgi:cell division protein FtsB
MHYGYAQRKPIENEFIVRERDKRRSRELLAVVLLGLPLGLLLWLFAWQNLEVIRLAREATRLRAVQTDLEKSNKRLKIEVERLTALDAVQSKAGAIGLQPSESARVVVVSQGAKRPARGVAR